MSCLSWFTMLFAGGIGTVLMFWGVAEQILHVARPPYADTEPHSVQAAREAMGFSLYHLGLGGDLGAFHRHLRRPYLQGSHHPRLVLGVLFAPSAFTLVWFAIFGWSAMEIDGIGAQARAALGDQAGMIENAIARGPDFAMFAFFENFPATQLIQGLAVVIVAIFFATSSDSASGGGVHFWRGFIICR